MQTPSPAHHDAKNDRVSPKMNPANDRWQKDQKTRNYPTPGGVVMILYLPVIHSGYLELIQKHQERLKAVYILDEELIELIDQELDYLRKDIRRLKPKEAVKTLSGLDLSIPIKLLSTKKLTEVVSQVVAYASSLTTSRPKKNRDLPTQIIMPDDDVSAVLIKKFFRPYIKQAADRLQPPTTDHQQMTEFSKSSNTNTQPETNNWQPTTNQLIMLEPVFLRWDKRNTFDQKPPKHDATISQKKFDQQVMQQAFEVAGNSTDWWRHVGAALVKNGQVILTASNQHTPGGYTPYVDGDPRSASKSGKQIEINTSEHAESALLAEAAKRGIKTQGCNLYVTTFPCPYCARIIAHAGISTLYFADGYTVLDGEVELKRHQVKLVKVEVNDKVKKLKDRKTKLRVYQKTKD